MQNVSEKPDVTCGALAPVRCPAPRKRAAKRTECQSFEGVLGAASDPRQTIREHRQKPRKIGVYLRVQVKRR